MLLDFLEEANLGPQRGRGRGRSDPKRNLNRVEKKLVTAIQARRAVWHFVVSSFDLHSVVIGRMQCT